jgi:hypothetical protein
MLDLDQLRKVGTCASLAAKKEVAEDIAKHIMDAADEIEKLRDMLKWAQSGFISGSGSDDKWCKIRDELIGVNPS